MTCNQALVLGNTSTNVSSNFSKQKQNQTQDLLQLLGTKSKKQVETQSKVKAVLLSLADAQEEAGLDEQKPKVLSECVDTAHQGPAEVSQSLYSLYEMAQRLQVPNQSARRLFLAGILDNLFKVSASSLKNGSMDERDWNRLTFSFTTALEIAQESRAFVTEKPRLTQLHVVARKMNNKFWPVPSSFKMYVIIVVAYTFPLFHASLLVCLWF